jgi:hypothetical protein
MSYYSEHMIVCIAAQPARVPVLRAGELSSRAKQSNLLRLPRRPAFHRTPRNDLFSSSEANYFMLPLITENKRIDPG